MPKRQVTAAGEYFKNSLDHESPSQAASGSAHECPLAPACHGLIGHVTGTAPAARALLAGPAGSRTLAAGGCGVALEPHDQGFVRRFTRCG
jgi:hypothetical protein